MAATPSYIITIFITINNHVSPLANLTTCRFFCSRMCVNIIEFGGKKCSGIIPYKETRRKREGEKEATTKKKTKGCFDDDDDDDDREPGQLVIHVCI